jgi:hypothetical protein
MAEQLDRGSGFDGAHGSVRDGLAALRNLENLLKSPRIGPRALGQVVAEVRPGSRPLGDAFSLLIDIIGRRNGNLPLVSELTAFTQARVTRLDNALVHAVRSDMGAKARLTLEAEVGRLASELDALRRLVDLLDAATSLAPTELDLNAVATVALAKLAAPVPRPPRMVHVGFSQAPQSATVFADPRVVIPLISVAIGLVARSGVRFIELIARSKPNGEALLACAAEGGESQARTPCVPPPIIAPTLVVARAAAETLGGRFVFDEHAQEAELLIPSLGISQTFGASTASR